jgi:hypothetical protein
MGGGMAWCMHKMQNGIGARVAVPASGDIAPFGNDAFIFTSGTAVGPAETFVLE